MSIVLAKPPVTPAELLAMPDAKSYELVDGRLVERNVSALSGIVESTLHWHVALFCDKNKLGPVWTGTQGFQCFPARPKRVRRPDVSFVKAERFTPDMFDAGFVQIAPDLAAEVISPGDLATELYGKIEDYLQAGVSLIWIVDPVTRVVQVYRKDGTVSRLHETDELLGEDVLPGFHCLVADLFPPRATEHTP